MVEDGAGREVPAVEQEDMIVAARVAHPIDLRLAPRDAADVGAPGCATGSTRLCMSFVCRMVIVSARESRTDGDSFAGGAVVTGGAGAAAGGSA